MTHNTTRYFGLTVLLPDEIEVAVYTHINNLISNIQKPVPEGAVVYVKQLLFDIRPDHFTVSGIENRVAQLTVKLELGQKAIESKSIYFVDLECVAHPEVRVKRSSHRISYSLDGNFLAKESQYHDYVAVVLLENCKDKYKHIPLDITAHATSAYSRQHIINRTSVTTTLDFYLRDNIQLTFWGKNDSSFSRAVS